MATKTLSQAEIENITVWLITKLSCDTIRANFSERGVPLHDEAAGWLNKAVSATIKLIEAGMLQSEALDIVSGVSDMARRMS